MFPGSANPKESPNSALPLHTQKQCTIRESSWGSSIPVYQLLLDTLGEGRRASRQPSNASHRNDNDDEGNHDDDIAYTSNYDNQQQRKYFTVTL